ncbi:MAG: cation diffusion facilitator family transporter, partial [Acidimicrobiales bacterium]
MGHDHHDHSYVAARAGERHKGRLVAAFALLATFMVVEVVGGLASGSLA